MEELKVEIKGAPLFILKAGIVREIITDAYSLARCIEKELRDIPQDKRKARKAEYSKDGLQTYCILRGKNGIGITIEICRDNRKYNSLTIRIDSNDDYRIRINSSTLDSLMVLRARLSELLINLSYDKNYLYSNYQYPETHAILIDENPIIDSILSSKHTDAKYNMLKSEKIRGNKFDCEVIIFPRLKAAYVENGMEVFGGIKL